MTAKLLVAHQDIPRPHRVDARPRLIGIARRLGRQQAGTETLFNQAAVGVAANGIERQADDIFAIAHDVRHQNQRRRRHLVETDIGISHARRQADGSFSEFNYSYHEVSRKLKMES